MRTLLACALLLALLALTVFGQTAEETQQQKENAKPPTPMSTKKYIRTVNGALFRELVMDPVMPVVLAFTSSKKSCKKCKAFMTAFEETAEVLHRGYALFTVVDAGEEEGKGLMQMFNINTGVPTVVLFNPELHPVQGQQEGSYMKQPFGMGGGTTTAKDMVDWLMTGIASQQIAILDDLQDTDDLLAEYQEFDMPKMILFTKEDQVLSPVYRAMSHTYRYGIYFGRANVTMGQETMDIADRFDVKTFPTVVAISNRGQDVEKLAHTEKSPITMEGLTEFCDRITLVGEARGAQQQAWLKKLTEIHKKAKEKKADAVLPPVIITSEKQWNKECLKRRKGVCVAVFVEDVNQESDMELLAEASTKISKRSSQKGTQVVIVDGQANYDMAEFYQAASGYPSVVFINPTKKGYHNLIGSYNPKSIASFFVDKVAMNKGKAYNPKEVPKFQVTPEAADDEAITDDTN